MAYLREFLGEYRKELNEVLADRQLARELEYDIDRWEKAQAAELAYQEQMLQQQQQLQLQQQLVQQQHGGMRTPAHGAQTPSSRQPNTVTKSGGGAGVLRTDPNFMSPLHPRTGGAGGIKVRATLGRRCQCVSCLCREICAVHRCAIVFLP